jgi:hypothetical protein
MLQISLLYACMLVLSVRYVLQHYNIVRSMHVEHTYVAGRQQYNNMELARFSPAYLHV